MKHIRWDNSARHSIWNVDHKRLEWPNDLIKDGRASGTFRRGELMAGIVSTDEALVLMGVYNHRSYQSAPTGRGVRVYIPIDSLRRQAPDTERPVVVSDQHQSRLCLGPCVNSFIQDAAESNVFNDYKCDYMNSTIYVDPITLEEISQPFQIRGHSLNLCGVDRGLNYARFLSGIRRIPSKGHDKITPRWRREMGLVKINEKYCQEIHGVIVRVFSSDPILEGVSWSPGVLVDKEGDIIFVHARGSMYAIGGSGGELNLLAVKRRVAEYEFNSEPLREELLGAVV